jgi:TonB-dependent SusC/RagA subfamily outer membrane receptor
MTRLNFCLLILAALLTSVKASAQSVWPGPAKIVPLVVNVRMQAAALIPARVVSPVAGRLPIFSLPDSYFASDTSSSHVATSPRRGTICYSYKASKLQSPLYVINGKVRRYWDMRNLAPSQIEQIKVVKGEQAAAIYGLRGRNGVVLITTKKNSWFPLR